MTDAPTKISTTRIKKFCPICRVSFDCEKVAMHKVKARRQDWTLKNQYNVQHAIDPLAYLPFTCSACLFTAYEEDFEDDRLLDNSLHSEALSNSNFVLNMLDVGRTTLNGPRDLRLGLASYYLAEIWYEIRHDLPARLAQLGLTAYRRAWLLDPALAAGIVAADQHQRDRQYALHAAENYLEQSYLSEGLPDQFFIGPDCGTNFGRAAFPYMIAALNHGISLEKEGTPDEKQARHRKAEKYLTLAQSAARTAPEPLAARAAELTDKIRGASSAFLKASAPAPAAAAPTVPAVTPAAKPHGFIPETEHVRWDIRFEALCEKFGEDFAPGQVIVRQGDRTNDFFLILEGKVRVDKLFPGEDGEPRVIASLGQGAFFGEMSLLDEQPRSATVVAEETTHVVRLSRNRLQQIIAHYPSIAISIMTILAQRLRRFYDYVQKEMLDHHAEREEKLRVESMLHKDSH